jgi:hypothetical protein
MSRHPQWHIFLNVGCWVLLIRASPETKLRSDATRFPPPSPASLIARGQHTFSETRCLLAFRCFLLFPVGLLPALVVTHAHLTCHATKYFVAGVLATGKAAVASVSRCAACSPVALWQIGINHRYVNIDVLLSLLNSLSLSFDSVAHRLRYCYFCTANVNRYIWTQYVVVVLNSMQYDNFWC